MKLTPYLFLDRSNHERVVTYLQSKKTFLLCINASRSNPTDIIPLEEFQTVDLYENVKLLLCHSEKDPDTDQWEIGSSSVLIQQSKFWLWCKDGKDIRLKSIVMRED